MEATPYNQMFVSWILNFLVNLRKIISLESHMKLESIVNEVFFYQNMYFLHAKIIHRCCRYCRWKIEKFCKFTFFTYNKNKKNLLESKFLITKF